MKKPLGRNSKPQRLLAITAGALLAASAMPAAAQAPGAQFASSSRLAPGHHWVKVKVTSTGVQAISHETLRQWGFDDPARVRVYGFSGVELAHNTFEQPSPDDLPLQYTEHTDSRLLFYGEADWRTTLAAFDMEAAEGVDRLSFDLKRNFYSAYSTYFLTDADFGEEMAAPVAFTPREATLATHQAIVYHEPEEANRNLGGALFFSREITSSNPLEVSLEATNFTGEGHVVYSPVARCRVPLEYQPTVSGDCELTGLGDYLSPIVANNIDYDNNIFSGLNEGSHLGIALQAPEGEGDTATVTLTFADTGVWYVDHLALDYAALVYERRNELAAGGEALELNLPGLDGLSSVSFTAAPEGLEVWDVTVPMQVQPLAVGTDTDGLAAVSPATTGNVRLVAFDPSSALLAEPELVDDPQITYANLHSRRGDVDMVIVTTPTLAADAKRLAALHTAKQGLDVDVALTTDIYNEFSSGAPSSIAIHRYAKMLYDRGNGRPAYLLLMGRGQWDNRQLLEKADDPLPTFQCEEVRSNPKGWFGYLTQNFNADTYFGQLGDDFSPDRMALLPMTMAVGRIPAVGSAKDYVDKAEDYLEAYLNDALPRSRAVLMADYGDDNNHLYMAEQNKQFIDEAQPGVLTSKIYLGLHNLSQRNYSAELREALASGAGFLGFCGHGNSSSIGMSVIITSSGASELVYGSYPAMFLATCNSLNFDHSETSFGETLLKSNPGPIGIVASGRTVYLNRNSYPFDGFTSAWFGASEGDRIGDAWRKAFNLTISNSGDENVGVNTLCYNLAGDPAMPIPVASARATVSTVNGEAISAGTPVEVAALQPIHLTGAVTDRQGNTLTGFNGHATVTLRDGATTGTTLGHNDTEMIDVALDDVVLAMAHAKVTAGLWEATLTPPTPLVVGSVNTVMVAAVDEESAQLAIDESACLSVADPAEGAELPDDTDGPEIAEMYLDSPTFNDGDNVGSSVTLHAVVLPDPSGFAIAGSQIGRRPQLTLDGAKSFATAGQRLVLQPDGSGKLEMQINGLNDGYHTIELAVTDNLGNISRRTIGFTVTDDGLQPALTLDGSIVHGGEPALLGLDLPASASATRLVVEDAEGNTVYTCENPAFPHEVATAELPDGLYRAYAWASSDNRWGRSLPLQFTVIK